MATNMKETLIDLSVQAIAVINKDGSASRFDIQEAINACDVWTDVVINHLIEQGSIESTTTCYRGTYYTIK